MYKVGIFIHELRYQNESRLDAAATRSCETLLQVLEECSVQVLPPPEVSGASDEVKCLPIFVDLSFMLHTTEKLGLSVCYLYCHGPE